MSKFLKSFLIAFSIPFVLHVLGAIYVSIDNMYDEDTWKDFVKNIPILFSLFFFPIFFSSYYFDERKSKLQNFIRPILISVMVLSFIEIIYSSYIIRRLNFEFIEVTFFRVLFVGTLISFIISLLLYIKNTKPARSNQEIQFSWKIVLFIPVVATLIYSVIVLLSSGQNSNILIVITRFFPSGLILTIITSLFFKQSSFLNNSRKIIIYYVLSLLIFGVMVNTSDFVSYYYVDSSKKNFVRNLLAILVLSSPYYMFVIGIIHLYFNNLSKNQENQFLKQQSLELQLNYQQLKSQLSPHFLFNNINVLTSLIEENPKKAVIFSENLSHIYRYFLEQEKQDVVIVRDEINFAQAYLALLKDRFEIGLTFSINIDEDVKVKYIVSTILQQVLENVVKHNEINKNNPVEVTISSEDNFIVIKNNKNPKLLTQNNSKKGIENFKRRLAFFTDEKVVITNSEKLYSIKLPVLEII